MNRKVAIITGCSSGLGKALSKKFMNEGWIVCGASRKQPDFTISHWIKTDLTRKEDLSNLVDEVKSKHERIDILINNAGVGIYDRWEDMEDDDLENLFSLNLFSMFRLTKKCIPLLSESGGIIVNTSSVAGILPVPAMGGYCASKYAVNAFSDTLRVEVRRYGISVLNLIVGRINTGFSSRSFGKREVPDSPGAGDPKELAEKVYKACMKRKREIYYPSWYRIAVPLIKLFRPIYEKENIRRWGL